MLVTAKTPGFKYCQDLLDPAGIQLNGNGACDIRVYNPDFFRRVLRDGTLGLGEAYMDGWWECDSIDELFCRGLNAGLEEVIRKKFRFLAFHLLVRIFNRQSYKRAFLVGKKHYDIGNDLFQVMLDPYMNYSCGYWSDAKDLNCAQEAKMNLICQKLQLKPGMRVLDVGCGTGLSGHALVAAGFTDIVGVDISADSLGLAAGREVYRELQQVNLKVLPTPFGDNSFDALTCVGVLTYLDDTGGMLREFCRLVKPGGHIVFTSRDDLYAERDFPTLMRALAEEKRWRSLYESPPSPYLPGNQDFGESIQVIYSVLEVRA